MLLASMCNKRQKVGTLRIYTVVTSLNQFESVTGFVWFFLQSISPLLLWIFFFKNKGAVKIFNFPLSVFAHSIKSSCNIFYLCSVLELKENFYTVRKHQFGCQVGQEPYQFYPGVS